MLIPLGPEDNVFRRHPVVCYAIAAINVLAYLLTTFAFDEHRWATDIEESAGQVEEYVTEHPYLQVSDEIQAVPPLADAVEESRAASNRRQPPADGIRRLEQSHLDGLVHDLTHTWSEQPAWKYGFVPSRPSPITLVTSMFMHGGFLHLAGNMLFFYIAGPLLEDLYGRPLFLALYMLSGFVGTGLHMLKSTGSSVPVVGASGAIAGLMGAFLVRLTATRIRFLFFTIFMFRIVKFTFRLPAWVVIPFWFAEDFIVASGPSQGSGIAHAAHVGGFVFGAFGAFMIKIFAIESRFVHPAIEAETTLARHPGFVAAVEARSRGEWRAAREEIDRALADEPDDIDALNESYVIALGEGDPAAAGSVATRLLARYEEEEELELAEELLKDCAAKLPGSMSPGLVAAGKKFFEEHGKPELAWRFAARAKDKPVVAPTGLMDLYRDAEMKASRGDREGAKELFRQALAHPACNESWKERIERALENVEPRAWDDDE